MIVGIDLGTTNSLVAYYTEDGPVIIPNRLGEKLTPSVVSIDDEGTVYVGKTARERMRIYPEQSASLFKRDMGTDTKRRLGDKEFSPEDLSALILRSLKEDAEVYLGQEITEAVISVPAYFNDMRRKATKRAGALAGLKVERIISEPTAAAIAYGLYNETGPVKDLIFDLGGGTFDVSILDFFEPIIEVRAVAGDNYLGGEDFTETLIRMFLSRNPGLNREELSLRDTDMLYNAAEAAKKELSDEASVEMSVTIDGTEYKATITYKEYNRECEPLYERMRVPIRRALSDSGLKASDLSKVVLVGGATRFPGVRDFVRNLLHTFPDITINPDEAVALGAAIQGALKSRDDSVKEVVLTDVCPFTLGTAVSVDLGDGRREHGHYCPIIERNTVIPTSKTDTFSTVVDNQTAMNIRILQGESRFADNNLELGSLHVEVPSGPAGQESVEVTYTYDINSILEVEAKVLSNGKQYRMIVKDKDVDMTDEEIDKRFKELSYLKVSPREQEENKLVLLRVERLYRESLGAARIMLERAAEKFDAALASGDKRLIDKERAELIHFLDEFE